METEKKILCFRVGRSIDSLISWMRSMMRDIRCKRYISTEDKKKQDTHTYFIQALVIICIYSVFSIDFVRQRREKKKPKKKKHKIYEID